VSCKLSGEDLILWYALDLTSLYACSGQFLGPGLLALIFMFTVASVPGAMFLFAAVAVMASIFLLGLVQLPKAGLNDGQGSDGDNPTADLVEQDIGDLALL
jgi:hypothetical protein